MSHFNNSDQASLTHNRHCGYSEVKWIHNGGERKDTELLRELLPRFISSCSVWRLQLSVLNVFIFYDRTEVVGWQSSYRISHNNNLKLQQYWQNIVLNGSYSKQTSHFDSNFLLCVLWSVSEFYLGLVGPHCSFLTNISFSLICFLFRVIIVISRHFLQHNMPSPAPTWLSYLSARAPGLVWPGCLAGLHRLVDVDYIAARPLPNLPWTAWPDCCWPRFAVAVAGSRHRKYRAAGMKVAAAAISGLHPRLCLVSTLGGRKNLSGWWWGVRAVINKPQCIPPVLSIVSSYDWGLYWIIFVVMIYKCILPADTTQNKVSWLFFERS